MKFKVFVSYSTDDLEIVNLLHDRLKEAPIEIFIAEYSISASEELTLRIKNEIKECNIFVVIWSESADKSDWVKQEVGMAKAHDKMIIPIVINENFTPSGFIQGLKYLTLFNKDESAIIEAENIIMNDYREKLNNYREEINENNKKIKRKQNSTNLILLGLGALFVGALIQE